MSKIFQGRIFLRPFKVESIEDISSRVLKVPGSKDIRNGQNYRSLFSRAAESLREESASPVRGDAVDGVVDDDGDDLKRREDQAAVPGCLVQDQYLFSAPVDELCKDSV